VARRTLLSVRPLDGLLLLMTVIWGTNYAVIKSAFADLHPQAFNALRLSIASLVLLGAMLAIRARRDVRSDMNPGSAASVFHTPAAVTRGEWMQLAALGAVGHTLYQYCFVGGLARTSVANSSLIIAMTPVLIAVLTTVGGQRLRRMHWLGTVLSVAGIYIVLGHGARFGGESLRGDLLVGIAVFCWAIYTMGSRPLMRRHSPLAVTGLSMAIGTLIYLPIAWPALSRVHWSAVSTRTWLALLYSALFALCVAYTIWYSAVRELGSARTAVYSNLIPIVAMATAVITLGEPLSLSTLGGAAAVIAGVALTRL
jgi:drug/metabolite transporter (DMT)-like permease